MAPPPEAAYSESSSVVDTKPRLREEVREETREEIRLLDMPRISPEEKLRLEQEAVESSVGEVELFERSWRKSQADTVFDIERKVDALGTGPKLPAELPTAARPATPPLRSRMDLDLSPAPAALPPRSGRALAGRLSPAEQRAIAKHLGGPVQRARVTFTTSRGRVVDVDYKKGDEALFTTVIVTEDGEVASLEDIGHKLDGMAMPGTPRGPVSRIEEALGPGPRPGAPEAERASGKRQARVLPHGRTTAGLLPTIANQDIEHVEGIGPVYSKKLRSAGLEIIEDLCLCDADQVAKDSSIQPELVHKWQNMGRLQAINGIGPQYSELLVRAGILTMADLAVQKPEPLAKKLNDYEASLGVRVQGTVINATQTESWIKQATELTKAAPEAAHGEVGPGTDATVTAPHSQESAPPPAEPRKKGFSLPLGRKKEAPAESTEEKPKRRFGLPFGKK